MKQFLRTLILLLLTVVWGGNGFAQTTLSVDFEKELATYTDWSFSNIAKANTITAHAGSYYGNTDGKTTAYVQTKNIVAAPGTLTFYISKETNNTTSSSWKVQVSTNGTKWTDVGSSISATSMKKGAWATATQDLTSYKNVYVRIYYAGTTAKRCIDDVSLTPAASKIATTLTFAKSSYNLIDGEEDKFEGQTATVTTKDGNEISNATITYTADDPNGILERDNDFATNGYALLKGTKTYGTATITATYTDASNTYESSTASYTVTYSPAQTPTLSFSAESVTVKQGEESKFVKPTIKFTDEKGEDIAEAADITYTVSPEDVVTIDDNGNITAWLKPGEATITATISYGKDGAGKDVYYDASYKLIYEKQKTATTLAFDKSTVDGEIGGTIAEMPVLTLTAGETVLTGKAIEYSSSDKTVATVDKATGALTLLGAGKATITAKFAGDDDYKASEASYTVTVTDPNVGNVTFDFINSDYGYTRPTVSGKGTEIKVGESISEGAISLKVTAKGTSDGTKLWYQTTMRCYADAKHLISAAEGYVITGISIAATNVNYAKYRIGGLSVGKAWSGKAKSVEVVYTAASRINSITVDFTKLDEVSFSEASDNSTTISDNADKLVLVKLTDRTLKPNVWNTFCVPFDVTIAGSALEGAAISKVKSVDESTATIYFEAETDKIEAGKAYLVKPAETIENPTFDGVTIQDVTPANTTGNDNYQFIGIYSPKTITADEFGTIFGVSAAGKLAKVKANTTMNGLRAYFVLPAGASAAKLNIDGEATAIDAIDADAAAAGARKVYDISGRYVGDNLESLPAGVYIVGGKKVLK